MILEKYLQLFVTDPFGGRDIHKSFQTIIISNKWTPVLLKEKNVDMLGSRLKITIQHPLCTKGLKTWQSYSFNEDDCNESILSLPVADVENFTIASI